MVSCSHALSIKRINLIIGGLSTVEDEDIKWIHIGDGEELQALQAEAQKKLGEMKNIQYQFVGALTNDNTDGGRLPGFSSGSAFFWGAGNCNCGRRTAADGKRQWCFAVRESE